MEIAQQEGFSLTETAKLLAVLNVAEADGAIAAWNAKYSYDTWRPVTAIQNAGDIGNRWIDRWELQDADRQSLLITPPFPEYVSGHSTFSAAAAEVLTSFFGKHYDFSFTALNGVTRNFDSFWDAAKEAGMSRIYGGIHFSFANKDGLALGEDMADWVLDSFESSGHVDLIGVALDTSILEP